MSRFVFVLTLSLCLAGLGLSADTPAKGGAKEEAKKDGSYIKIEARGTLLTGVQVAGETAGVMIRTTVGAFELDLEKTLKAQAEKMNDKMVVISGVMATKPDSKFGPRMVISVESLKAAK